MKNVPLLLRDSNPMLWAVSMSGKRMLNVLIPALPESNASSSNPVLCFMVARSSLSLVFDVLYSIISIYFIAISAISLFFVLDDFSYTLLILYIFAQCLLGFSICILLQNSSESFGNKKYSYSEKESNVIGIINKSLNKKDIFGYPYETEICEFCLTQKEVSTHHCLKCDKCVKNYFFHSNLFNKCIHRNNVKGYILYLFFIFILYTAP